MFIHVHMHVTLITLNCLVFSNRVQVIFSIPPYFANFADLEPFCENYNLECFICSFVHAINSVFCEINFPGYLQNIIALKKPLTSVTCICYYGSYI